jgi:hypothetical protein
VPPFPVRLQAVLARHRWTGYNRAMEPDQVKYCMRCLEELQATTRRECFKCHRVTCDKKDCGIWAVMNRFWTCHICVNEEIDAMIDLHEKKSG